MSEWTQVSSLHRTLAEAVPDDIAPHVAACRGDDGLGIVRLRPFDPGAYAAPLIEALALLLPLGADRISIGMPGRAWSLDDPVVPVCDDQDLRQRVIVEVQGDGHDRSPARVTTLIHPFDVVDGDIAWEPTVDPGPGEGWMVGALATLLDQRDELAEPEDPWTIGDQAARLDALGHGVMLTAFGHTRLLARSQAA